MSKEFREGVISKLLDNLTYLRPRTNEDRVWIEKFNTLSDLDKRALILSVFLSQDRTLKEGILKKEDVHLLHLGTFKYNPIFEKSKILQNSGMDRETRRKIIIQDIKDSIINRPRCGEDHSLEAVNLLRQQLNK